MAGSRKFVVRKGHPLTAAETVSKYGVGAAALDRLRDEFLEMPGLVLTEKQASRLFGISAETCSELLEALVNEGLIERTADGRYTRPHSKPAPRRASASRNVN